MVIEATAEGPQEDDESTSSLMQAVLGQQQTLVMRDVTLGSSLPGSQLPAVQEVDVDDYEEFLNYDPVRDKVNRQLDFSGQVMLPSETKPKKPHAAIMPSNNQILAA